MNVIFHMEIIIPTDYFLRWLKHVKTTNQRIFCEQKSGWCVVPWKNRSLGAFGQVACVRRWMTVKPAQYDALSPCGLAALRLVNWEEKIFRVGRITGLFMFVLGFIMGYYIYNYIYNYIYIYMCMIMYVYIYIYRTGFSTKQLSYWCLKWQSSSNIFHKSLDSPGPPGPIGVPHDSAVTCCNYI